MIQRIQTLYLLLVVALATALMFVPVLTFVTPAESAEQAMIHAIPVHGLSSLNGWWGMAIATVLIAILALVDIFLYRNRILQARLNIFTACLCVGWYGVLLLMGWFGEQNMTMDFYLTPWCSIPLVCFILILMATRAILRDEALVRAADRIR